MSRRQSQVTRHLICWVEAVAVLALNGHVRELDDGAGQLCRPWDWDADRT